MAVKPLSGRPLYANAADEPLYVAPVDVVARIERSIERELNTLVLGERGSGKTSLLQHLLLRTRTDRSPGRAAYVDASIARSPIDVIELIREQLGIDVRAGESVAEVLRASGDPGSGAQEASLLLQRLEPLRDGAPCVILLDGLGADDIAHTLFGRLRDELWGLPLTWVVTAAEAERSRFLAPPADAFFETVVELEPLSALEQLALLRRRLPGEWSALEPLVDAGRGNPRQLLGQAREVLVSGRPIDEVLWAHYTREDRARALGVSAVAMLDVLESLGQPVAASDVSLLRRLGVTRERATQVLNQLEAEGLVESFSAPSERGRPRKLYRIRETPALSRGKREV
jgi:Cdc6-like AAA superfamily ATPase